MTLSKTEIALKSKEQLLSLTVPDLKEYCQILELKGYSRKTKILLVEMVFQASNIERQAISNNKLTNQVDEIDTATLKKEYRKQNTNVENPINVNKLNELLNKGLDIDTIANVLFNLCSKFYTDLTVAKNRTKDLKEVLPETNFTLEEQEEIIAIWGKLVYAINYTRAEEERILLKSYAREAVDNIDTEAIVDWAINNLKAENYIHKGLALSLLSGRRLGEIYGTTSYKLGELGIIVEGLLKTKDGQSNSCEFLPLCDRELWLEAWQKFPKRNLEEKKIRNNIPKANTRNFPLSLKDLKITKFKDCRDAYAAIAYQTFDSVTRDAIPFTKLVMGHKTQESTAYYRKFDCQALDNMKEIFEQYTYL